jgi:hypothetical protein
VKIRLPVTFLVSRSSLTGFRSGLCTQDRSAPSPLRHENVTPASTPGVRADPPAVSANDPFFLPSPAIASLSRAWTQFGHATARNDEKRRQVATLETAPVTRQTTRIGRRWEPTKRVVTRFHTAEVTGSIPVAPTYISAGVTIRLWALHLRESSGNRPEVTPFVHVVAEVRH